MAKKVLFGTRKSKVTQNITKSGLTKSEAIMFKKKVEERGGDGIMKEYKIGKWKVVYSFGKIWR